MTNSYIGMNFNLDCVCYDAWDETTIMAFKGDVIQFFTNEVLSRTDSRLAMFPEIGTNTVSSVYRASQAGTNPNTFWQLYFYNDAGDYWRYETTSLNPTGYTFLNSGSHPWMVDVGPRGENWTLWFRLVNGVAQVDLNGNTGLYVPYGPGTSYYPTLPNTQVPDACWHNTTTGVVYVSIIDTIYLLDTTTTTVTSFAKYNQPVGPPPTPLPDIVVTYYSPQDYGFFASNTALVSETQYGFNFTKTGLANADKMELYLYFATAPGAIPFNYNDLRDIRVLMKNNLVLQPGEIFFNIYTVGTAGGWYGTRTTYLGTPPLGTTFDPALVETIIPLSDSRTDQILAISLGSNSAGQQFNFDVERASFEILLPSTNETQRVEVKLQNSFIALDDEYWNLDQTAEGYTGNTITASTAWDINLINPNIIAGNYPQTATFSQNGDSGTAWNLNGVFTNWTTTDNITWTNSGNTVTFSNNPGIPGIASNGAAYVGCNGTNTNAGTWTNPPIGWRINNQNLFVVRYATGGQEISYRLLADLPTPNNFTAAQMESGCFASSVTGTQRNVLISSVVPPAKQLVYNQPGTMKITSNTAMTIRRDWELTDTLYTINPSKPNSITGQYIDPAFPISYTPDNYVMPTNWSVLAEDHFNFEILFSAGLNNSLPAESQNFRQMTVTPTPSLASLSFTWTANYYTAGNILIGPVAGIQTTGLVSGFTTGGSLKPANAAYILYGCTSNQNVDAFASLVFIEPEPPSQFDLLFNRGLINTMFSDGPYTVNVSPVATGVTYTFTGKFYDVNNGFLGDLVFTPQPDFFTYTFSFATFPSAKYISFVGTSSEGVTAQLSIAICEPQPEPPGPPVITSITTEEAIINKINYHPNESHKIIDDSIVSELVVTLTDGDGRVKYTNDNIYYEVEFKEIDFNP